ncbi:protein FAR1-RELATED SEQUENCE 5-like [Citrus clementina]|uniref:protein FAR1-RELATED SEQUENCE 5-like n=1 Tax=Citrus clementina TaxID=85681 RepID=UPI0007638DBE|nr:protein FAR1-RELATED SEQUENCE 5-like [Citrus x clementina]
MTTSLDVGSISAWVLDLNDNQPSEQKISGPPDNPSYDNGMEICASAGTSLPPQTSEISDYFGDKSATRSSSHTTYSLPKKSELIEVGVGSCFENVNDAHIWYKKYAKSVGFSVRKDELRCDGKSGEVASRRWVCSGQGYKLKKWMEKTDRIREPRGITRNGCKAELRVNYDKFKGKYVVTKFVFEHTHRLVEPHETQFLRLHRLVNEADLAHAKALRQVGVKVCQLMNYKSDQAGGFHHVGYMGKDMRNRIDADHHAQIIDTDTKATIAYLSARVDYDAGVYFEYTLDEENRLRNLFWTDTVARYDYEQFGDVLGFDATYKKNAYNKPLVAFVGVNHHKRTTVFGFTILIDETVESYVWLLQTFLSAMKQKKPISVITDGDKAMSKAIKTVMPGCVHRLCCWHLERNAQANVKRNKFTSKFRQLMLNPMTMEEFDRDWFSMIWDWNKILGWKKCMQSVENGQWLI